MSFNRAQYNGKFLALALGFGTYPKSLLCSVFCDLKFAAPRTIAKVERASDDAT